MRTKTLLIAAAALAATVISSEAQTVYSANIVGYVNVTAPGGEFVLLANPFTTGNDVLSNVVQGVAGATTVNFWNGTGFTTATYKQGPKQWQLAGNINCGNTPLPPGVGFFLNSANTTNITFVGSVVTPAGGTSTNALSANTSPVGSLTPYSDVVTNAATFNLQVAGATTLNQWDVTAQTFRPTFTYKQGPKVWQAPGNITTNPVIGVAEGFFLTPTSPTNWVQSLAP